MGGHHIDARENLTTHVEKRLNRNVKLSGQLLRSYSRSFCQSDTGLILPTTYIKFDPEKLRELYIYIAKALAYFHLNRLSANHRVFNFILGHDKDMLEISIQMEIWMNDKGNGLINGNLGNGSVLYRGIKAGVNSSIWEIGIYQLKFIDEKGKIIQPKFYVVLY